MEMNWGLVGRSLKSALDKGFVRVSHNPSSIYQPYVFSYLTAPNIRKLDEKVPTQKLVVKDLMGPG